jgi:hypothetical protein
MATEVTQEALKAEPSRDKLERSLEDLRRIQGELHTRSQEMEAGFRDADSIHLPGDHLSYPIHRFGLAFSSRRAFVAFVAGIGLLVAQAVVSLDFPAPQIDQAGMWVSLVLLFRGIFVGGQLTARTILSVFLVALAAATISGAIAYRVPVGAYDWGESSSLTDGNYALVGENDSTVFVVPCNEAPAGVTAIPREAVIRINFPHDALEPRGPSLLQIATVPGSSPRIGALAVCRA